MKAYLKYKYMRTLNAKDKVLKRTKKLKDYVAYYKHESIEGSAYTMKEAKLAHPEAISFRWYT